MPNIHGKMPISELTEIIKNLSDRMVSESQKQKALRFIGLVRNYQNDNSSPVSEEKYAMDVYTAARKGAIPHEITRTGFLRLSMSSVALGLATLVPQTARFLNYLLNAAVGPAEMVVFGIGSTVAGAVGFWGWLLSDLWAPASYHTKTVLKLCDYPEKEPKLRTSLLAKLKPSLPQAVLLGTLAIWAAQTFDPLNPTKPNTTEVARKRLATREDYNVSEQVWQKIYEQAEMREALVTMPEGLTELYKGASPSQKKLLAQELQGKTLVLDRPVSNRHLFIKSGSYRMMKPWDAIRKDLEQWNLTPKDKEFALNLIEFMEQHDLPEPYLEAIATLLEADVAHALAVKNKQRGN